MDMKRKALAVLLIAAVAGNAVFNIAAVLNGGTVGNAAFVTKSDAIRMVQFSALSLVALVIMFALVVHAHDE